MTNSELTGIDCNFLQVERFKWCSANNIPKALLTSQKNKMYKMYKTNKSRCNFPEYQKSFNVERKGNAIYFSSCRVSKEETEKKTDDAHLIWIYKTWQNLNIVP